MDNNQKKEEKGYCVSLDGIRYVFDVKPLLKKDGSPFFSREEAIELRNELGINDQAWRYPSMIDSDETIKKRYDTSDDEMWRFATMAEMKAIIAMINFRFCNPTEFSGRYFAARFGVDTHLGCELINGIVRHQTSDPGFYFWTDPVLSPGYVRITDNEVEFCETKTPASVTIKKTTNGDDDRYDDGYDMPDVQSAYCVLLVRTEEEGYETQQMLFDPDFEPKYAYNDDEE